MVINVDNFANIGKAVLIQALGLQKNYQEIIESTKEIIDYNNSACTDCKWKHYLTVFDNNSDLCKQAKDICNNCPHKQITTVNTYKKIYHNEKNKYGYKPRLKNNALKLLILLNFNHPDRFGIIKNIDVRELSNTLDCNIRTVFNNLNILQAYNYISYCKLDTYIINLCLSDYDSYYLPAQKGGRGFIVMSKNLLDQIISLDNLVSLRIHLRELIELDSLNAKGPFTAISKNIKDIKRVLPDYCKPCIIKKSIKNSNNIFDITINDASIRFEIKNEFNCKLQKENCFNEYCKLFDNFIVEFNNAVSLINTNNSYDLKFKSFFDVHTLYKPEEYSMISFKDYEIEDMAQLSIQYSYDMVLEAYRTIYITYILEDKKINNLGGLLRTIVLSQLNNSLMAA